MEVPGLNQSQATVLDLSASEELCTDPLPLEQVRRAYATLPPHRIETSLFYEKML